MLRRNLFSGERRVWGEETVKVGVRGRKNPVITKRGVMGSTLEKIRVGDIGLLEMGQGLTLKIRARY